MMIKPKKANETVRYSGQSRRYPKKRKRSSQFHTEERRRGDVLGSCHFVRSSSVEEIGTIFYGSKLETWLKQMFHRKKTIQNEQRSRSIEHFSLSLPSCICLTSRNLEQNKKPNLEGKTLDGR